MGQSQTPGDRPTIPPPTGAAGTLSPGLTGPASQPEGLPPGTKLGKYQVRALLGRGGMGAVHEAVDTILNRPVALKILPRELAQNEQALRRFVREAQLAARLSHPNAVAVYEIARKGSVYFIAMELVRGRSAQALLDAGTRPDWKTATRHVADACRALVAAHEAGLIHRDIKPANLLIGDNGTAKLGDFGLARPAETDNLAITRQDAILGTPHYMSPEQAQNARVDARSDLYSLGATYYALLTGSAPFERGSALQILFAHCSSPVPDPRTATPDLPPLCTHIVHKSMAKTPEERYPSAREMLADLEAALSDSAMPAGLLDALEAGPAAGEPAPGGLVRMERVGGAAKRKRTPVIAWAVAAVVFVAVGALAGAMLFRGEERAGPAGPPPSPVALAPVAPTAVVETVQSQVPTQEPVREPASEPVPEAVAEAVENAQPAVAESVVTESVVTEAVMPEVATPVEDAGATAPPPAQEPSGLEPSEPVDPITLEPGIVEPRTGEPGTAQGPEPEEVEDDSDRQLDPAVRAYRGAKLWTASAAKRNDAEDLKTGAKALILWSDFFARSPRADHEGLAEEAEKLAERADPGIASRQPREPADADGPPVPPRIVHGPRGEDGGVQPNEDRPQPPEHPQPPERRERPRKRP